MADAHRGAFDVLVVWTLDRFGRSMTGNLAAVLALDAAGVQLVSVQETWLDTSGPVRPLLIAVFSWVAEQERARLIERTNAGLARARAKGVRLGRPVKAIDLREARQLFSDGLSVRQVARHALVWPLRPSRTRVGAQTRVSPTGQRKSAESCTPRECPEIARSLVGLSHRTDFDIAALVEDAPSAQGSVPGPTDRVLRSCLSFRSSLPATRVPERNILFRAEALATPYADRGASRPLTDVDEVRLSAVDVSPKPESNVTDECRPTEEEVRPHPTALGVQILVDRRH